MTAPLIWRKSSFSSNLACIELARCVGRNAVRDSKAPNRILRIPGRGARQLISFAKM
jgi:hypothetical protein